MFSSNILPSFSLAQWVILFMIGHMDNFAEHPYDVFLILPL